MICFAVTLSYAANAQQGSHKQKQKHTYNELLAFR